MGHTDSARSREEAHGSLRSYSLGFLYSLFLTVVLVVIVKGDWLEGNTKVLALMTAGVLQLFVQLLFFMHLKEEKKPRYNLLALVFGLVILIVIVGGSMWIMLYNMTAS